MSVCRYVGMSVRLYVCMNACMQYKYAIIACILYTYAIQYNTMQYNTIQYNIIECEIALARLAQYLQLALLHTLFCS